MATQLCSIYHLLFFLWRYTAKNRISIIISYVQEWHLMTGQPRTEHWQQRLLLSTAGPLTLNSPVAVVNTVNTKTYFSKEIPEFSFENADVKSICYRKQGMKSKLSLSPECVETKLCKPCTSFTWHLCSSCGMVWYTTLRVKKSWRKVNQPIVLLKTQHQIIFIWDCFAFITFLFSPQSFFFFYYQKFMKVWEWI